MKKMTRILIDLGDKPLTVIGPPGSGKTTITTTLALLKHKLSNTNIIYTTQKREDAIGSAPKPAIPWECIRNNLFLILDSYEELSTRPGITILTAIAHKFKTLNNYLKYLRYLSKNPRNTHATWLLERLLILNEIITNNKNYTINPITTIIQSRDIRGVYTATALVLYAMCQDGKNKLIILDDVSTLPIRDEALLRILRITRGVTNVWLVMHSLGKLSIDDMNTPVIITSHGGLSKTASRYQELLRRIKPGEALYVGNNEEIKLKLNDVTKLRNELTTNPTSDKSPGTNA